MLEVLWDLLPVCLCQAPCVSLGASATEGRATPGIWSEVAVFGGHNDLQRSAVECSADSTARLSLPTPDSQTVKNLS